MNIKLPIIALSFFLVACAQGAPTGNPPFCSKLSSSVCIISFFSVFSSESDLDGKLISVQGYLRKHSWGYSLYPTVETLRHAEAQSSILLVGEDRFFSNLAYENGRRVTVVGLYKALATNAWGTIELTNRPLEVPEVVDPDKLQ